MGLGGKERNFRKSRSSVFAAQSPRAKDVKLFPMPCTTDLLDRFELRGKFEKNYNVVVSPLSVIVIQWVRCKLKLICSIKQARVLAK